jgi:hypothetical protein
MRREVPWLRVGVEGVVILVSILLAFGIDAWWAQRVTRQEENTELQRVSDELVAERERIAGFATLHAYASNASLSVVELIERQGTTPATLAVSDTLLVGLFMVPTFETEAPTLEALTRSGRIYIIENARVRAAIAASDRSTRHAQDVERRARGFTDDQLAPALAARGPIGHIIRSTRFGGRAVEEIDPGGVTTLRVDEELAVLLSQRFATAGAAARSLRDARVKMDSVLVAIAEAKRD